MSQKKTFSEWLVEATVYCKKEFGCGVESFLDLIELLNAYNKNKTPQQAIETHIAEMVVEIDREVLEEVEKMIEEAEKVL